MSPRPFADARPHYFWLSLAATGVTIGILVLTGRHEFAAAGIGIALAVAFLRVVWREITARTVAFLAAGAIAYLIAWNRGIPFLYAFSAGCFGLVVVGHLLPRWMMRPVNGRINCPPSVVQGDTAELAITVENPSAASLRMIELEVLVPGALSEDAHARALIVQLAPGATENLAVRTPPLKRGCHEIGPITVTSGFPLGLATQSLPVSGSERSLWVYPRLFPVEFVPLAGEQFQQMGEAISPRGGGTEDFAGVREYRHGDSRRSIHWRASARRNELVVKEFMRVVATTLTIAVDLGKAANAGEGIDTAVEDAIRIAGSAARYALAERHHVQLVLCGRTVERVGPFRHSADMEAVLRALALARCDGVIPFGAHLGAIAELTPPNSTLMLVYADANPGDLRAVGAMRSRGVLVVPVVIEAMSYGGMRVAERTRTPSPVHGRARGVRQGTDLPALFRA